MKRHFAHWSATIPLAAVLLLGLAACDLSDREDEPVEPASSLTASVMDVLCDTEDFMRLADSAVAALDKDGHEARPDSELDFIAQRDLNHGAAHDCQRLIDPGVKAGHPMDELPLVALYVSRGQLEADDFAAGRTVAAIVNYGPGRYEPLGIPEGLSCLWIESGPGGWTAGIGVPDAGENCVDQDFNQDNLAVRHEVKRHQIRSGPAEYPSTARWMWDDSARTQFIGTRCARGWCEIGPAGFQGTSSIPTAADVPGRWDEQYLARPAADGGLAVSDLYGRIEPGADNERAATRPPEAWQPAPAAAESLHVATLHFDGEDSAAWSAYADKFALPTDVMQGHRIHYSTVESPPGSGNLVRRARSPMARWTEMRRSEQSHSGAGTVRWAWSEADEGFWIPCDHGCCISTGLESR